MKTYIIEMPRSNGDLQYIREQLDTKYIKSEKKIEVIFINSKDIENIKVYKDMIKVFKLNISAATIISEIKDKAGKSSVFRTDLEYNIKEIEFDTAKGIPTSRIYEWGTEYHNTYEMAKTHIKTKLQGNIKNNKERIDKLQIEIAEQKQQLARYTDTKDLFKLFEDKRDDL